MSERFTASNGYEVERLVDGQTKITRSKDGAFEGVTWCGGDEYLAIAEHALAERDRELGRERVEGYPDYAVYGPDEDGDIWVLSEMNAATVSFFTRVSAMNGVSKSAEVARAWFASQEPPKPWMNAAEGSAWRITVPHGTFAAIFQAGRFRDHGGWWNTGDITDAELLWSPEPGDES